MTACFELLGQLFRASRYQWPFMIARRNVDALGSKHEGRALLSEPLLKSPGTVHARRG